MVDMWMLSVAAALTGSIAEPNSAPVLKLTATVRAVPGLGELLDVARASSESDRIPSAEALANGLEAAYRNDGIFAARLDALWPEVLFAPRTSIGFNIVRGVVEGTVVQLGSATSINFTTPPAPAEDAPVNPAG